MTHTCDRQTHRHSRTYRQIYAALNYAAQPKNGFKAYNNEFSRKNDFNILKQNLERTLPAKQFNVVYNVVLLR